MINDDSESNRERETRRKRRRGNFSAGEAFNRTLPGRKTRYLRPYDLPPHEDDFDMQRALLESFNNSSPGSSDLVFGVYDWFDVVD